MKEKLDVLKRWMANNRKKCISIIIALLIILGGAGYYAYYQYEAYMAAHHIVLQGNVNLREVNVAFRGSDRISSLLMDEGAVVTKGQILGYLNSDELNLAVQQAKATIAAQEAVVAKLQAGSRPEEIAQASARVTSAEASLAQSKQESDKLQKSYNASNGKAVSRQSVDDIQAKVKVSEAKLNEAQQAYNLAVAGPRQEDIAQAQAQLDSMKSELARQEFLLNQTVLTAPIDGVITARLLQVGDMASPSTPVFKLAENTKKWVHVYVNERDLGKIYNGMDANVTTDTNKNEPIHGTIGYISSVAEFTPKSVETEDVRTTLVYEVRVYVDDLDNRLRLGMPATVSIDI